MLTVTTSWDDGDVLDERLAALLSKYGIRGTFYISKDYRPERLTEDAIRTLATTHEIGAHTLTHHDLPLISRTDKSEEIAGSKAWLEGVIGKEVSMFCYPKGLLDDETEAVVRESGFRGARDTNAGSIHFTANPYRIPTTLQVYPMPFRKIDATRYWWGKLLEPYMQRASALQQIGVPFAAFRTFPVLARAAFDAARARGEVFHLWGHSWEIERYGQWEEFEEVLKYIGNREDCRYLTNGEIVDSYA